MITQLERNKAEAFARGCCTAETDRDDYEQLVAEFRHADDPAHKALIWTQLETIKNRHGGKRP